MTAVGCSQIFLVKAFIRFLELKCYLSLILIISILSNTCSLSVSTNFYIFYWDFHETFLKWYFIIKTRAEGKLPAFWLYSPFYFSTVFYVIQATLKRRSIISNLFSSEMYRGNRVFVGINEKFFRRWRCWLFFSGSKCWSIEKLVSWHFNSKTISFEVLTKLYVRRFWKFFNVDLQIIDTVFSYIDFPFWNITCWISWFRIKFHLRWIFFDHLRFCAKQ